MTEENKDKYIKKNISLLEEFLVEVKTNERHSNRITRVVFFDINDPKFNSYNTKILSTRPRSTDDKLIHVSKVTVDKETSWNVSEPILVPA